MMDDAEIRLECLRLALAQNPNTDPAMLVDAAMVLHHFVSGAPDIKAMEDEARAFSRTYSQADANANAKRI